MAGCLCQTQPQPLPAQLGWREGGKLLLWSLTVQGWVFQKTRGGESGCDSIMSCKSLCLTSVTFSLIPCSPNCLYAFFSLTKDESKRPKYKELLVSFQCCICQCLQHTAHGAGLRQK